MKLKTLLLIIPLFCAIGCQPGNVTNPGDTDHSKIAGTWKAEKSLWQIVITEDGLVKSAVFPMGEATVIPNETTYITMKDDTKSSYRSGDFPLVYDPKHSELEVTIMIEEFHIRFLDNRIDGNHEAVFFGEISDDGTTWDGSVVEIFDYGPRLPQGEEGIMPVPIKFTKVSN